MNFDNEEPNLNEVSMDKLPLTLLDTFPPNILVKFPQDIRDKIPQDVLARLETPFTWLAASTTCPRRTQQEFMCILGEKRENKEGCKAQWQIVMVSLALAYEYWKLGDSCKTRQLLDECDHMLTGEGDEMPSCGGDEMPTCGGDHMLTGEGDEISSCGGGNMLMGGGDEMLTVEGDEMQPGGGGNMHMGGGDEMLTRGGDEMLTRGGDEMLPCGGGNMLMGGGDDMLTCGGDEVPPCGGGNMLTGGGDEMLKRGGDEMLTRGGDEMPPCGGGNMLMGGGDDMLTCGGDEMPPCGGDETVPIDQFIVINRAALKYVIQSSRFFLAGDDRERREILLALPRAQDLPDHVLGGILGIRAAVLMEYGYGGTCEAITHARAAIRLDPEAAEWHFIYGKAIGRRRHVENAHDCLTVEELKSLETAVELSASRNPYYVIFLAQAYREAAGNLRHERDPRIARQVAKMNDRAYQLYERAVRLRPECPHINVRCAQGYMRFLESHRDSERAYRCCQTAILAAPANTMVNHVWGQINERLGHHAVALVALQRAAVGGAYGAYMDWIRLKRQLDPRYDPLDDLGSLLTLFPDPPYQRATLTQLASYYYFVLDDATKAVRCLLEAVHSDPMTDKMRCHYPITFGSKKPVNLYSVLVHEAALTMEAGGKEDYLKIMTHCEEHFPEVLQTDNYAFLNWYRNQAQKSSNRYRPILRPAMTSRSDADKNWRKAESTPEVGIVEDRKEVVEKRPDARIERAPRWGYPGARESWRSGDGVAAGGQQGKQVSWRDKAVCKGVDVATLGGGDCRPGSYEGKAEDCKGGVNMPWKGNLLQKEGFVSKPLAERLEPSKKGVFFPNFSA